jgi:exosortase A-associated hydrolase 1
VRTAAVGNEPGFIAADAMIGSYSEKALLFECNGESLVGVLSLPASPGPRGVVIVVGGPQYRAGSHRQFTLLARQLAANGIATLRFDYRGMGDSTGAARSFETVHEDIRRALDVLFERVSAVKEAVIWGLCDAASAALMYAHRDTRVTGLVLLNPWVRTAHTAARTELKHYYGARLFDASFWAKLIRGEVSLLASARSLAGSMATALTPSSQRRNELALLDRMRHGLQRFDGKVLLILSGNDLTAQEFKDVITRSTDWEALLRPAHVGRCEIAEANHTFSARQWRDQVARWTCDWIKHLS